MNKLLPVAVAILPLLFSTYFLFLKDPPIWPDEATSFHQAQALMQTGKINANNYGGIPIEAKRAGLGFPPLYFITLGIWTNVFGESIESVRALSVTIALLSAILFFYIVRFKFNNIKLALFGTLLLTFNVYFGQTSRLGRPEILTLFIMMASLLCVKYPLLSGFLAALASASHPVGILAVAIVSLGFLFSPLPLKVKALYSLWTLSCLILITLSWIILTQSSFSDFVKAFLLGLQGRSYSLHDSLATFIPADPIWAIFLIAQVIVLLILFFKAKDTFILLSVIISIIWVSLQKAFYYGIYPQPFIILAILVVIQRWKLVGQVSVFLFFLLINIYLQFFDISYYTPARNFMQLDNFNYHQYVSQIKNTLPTGKQTIFLAAIPDPSLDLKNNEQYQLYQAIDPNYPVSEEDYKETLDKTDYVIYTWIPHDFLANYLAKNSLKSTEVSAGGYNATLVQLKPKIERN